MAGLNEYKLTDSFTVAVGQTVDRQVLDQAIQEAKANGLKVRLCLPGSRGDMSAQPDRLNIHLDHYDEVTRLNFM